MNRLFILFALFVTIIMNGIIFDVLQPVTHDHDNGSNHGSTNGH